MIPRRLIAWGAIGLAFIFLLGLGTWQVIRHITSAQQRDYLTTMLQQKPIAITALTTTTPEFTPVTLQGIVDTDRVVKVGGQFVETQPVHHILAPVVLESGKPVWVDFGWQAVETTPRPLQPRFALSYRSTGLLRYGNDGNSFTPAGDSKTKLWYAFDIADMNQRLGLRTPNFYIQEIGNSLMPVVNPPRPIMPQPPPIRPHLQYAATWYGLALALAIMVGVWYYQRRRRHAVSQHPRG